MPSYRKVKAAFIHAFLGASNSSDSSAACAIPRQATLSRPEGLRHYLVATPAGPASGKRPLVMVIHGGGASARQVMGLAFPPSPLSVWLDIAEREQLVVIAPDAGKGGWHDCHASAARVACKDDVAFIDALIEHAIAAHDVDPTRVFVTGVSRGAMLTSRVAAEIAHKLAGVANVLAGLPMPGAAPYRRWRCRRC